MEHVNNALINGLEARVTQIEDKLEDLDARTSEEADNALNEREMDRFIMSGISSSRMCSVMDRLKVDQSISFDLVQLILLVEFRS